MGTGMRQEETTQRLTLSVRTCIGKARAWRGWSRTTKTTRRWSQIIMSDSRRYSSIFRGIWQQFLPRKEELARLYRQFGAPHDPSKPFCILAETPFRTLRLVATGTKSLPCTCSKTERSELLLDTGEEAGNASLVSLMQCEYLNSERDGVCI